MYLKSLTLKGFKSFASATSMAFEPGITAIVGPNGSGKSNVVDALAWVMGEQGAKSLRGAKMDDVIFAGTADRPALGRAEVCLTIDNCDGVLPIDYTEVTISRTLFRNGGSEYAINGTACRLLDVQDLLSDTGMGNQMHVIVGQGQLDQILQAGPEQRRSFVEEAAGVLKHRRRKDKAVRKLASTQANMARLNDLIAEIRRQLKPLGRQATIARKAAVIQSELRDAQARLLADDIARVREQLRAEDVKQASIAEEKRLAQHEVQRAQEEQAEAEAALSRIEPQVTAAQETWYNLAGLAQKFTTVTSISAERQRHAEQASQPQAPRQDPVELERRAQQMADEEEALRKEVQDASKILDEAMDARNQAEEAETAAQSVYAAQMRAVADRREGLARLRGQVNSLTARLQAGSEEIDRLSSQLDHARNLAHQAEVDYAGYENQYAVLSDSEAKLDAAWEQAAARLEQAQAAAQALREQISTTALQISQLRARREALEMALTPPDASGHLIDTRSGSIQGSLVSMMTVDDGWQKAITAALDQFADSVVVADRNQVVGIIADLRSGDHGRARFVIADAQAEPPVCEPELELGICAYRVTHVDSAAVQAAVNTLLADVVLCEDLNEASRILDVHPHVRAVTRDGDLLGCHLAQGGSSSGASLLEIRASLEVAVAELSEAEHHSNRLTFEAARADEETDKAQRAHDQALADLNDSDAKMSALTEQLAASSQAARNRHLEIERIEQSIQARTAQHGLDEAKLAELSKRLDQAGSAQDLGEPDSEAADRAAVIARQARTEEMEARLSLRTAEERLKSVAGRADSLRRSAARERQAQIEAHRHAERMKQQAAIAHAVNQASQWLEAQVLTAQVMAQTAREAATRDRAIAETQLKSARRSVQERLEHVRLIDERSRDDQMARIELQLRLEQFEAKAAQDLSLDAQTLIEQFGPDQPIPVLVRSDGSVVDEDEEQPDPVPFVRSEQQTRWRKAQRDLTALGKVNPLALEEYAALNERHSFLVEQANDVNKTRKDLIRIIDDIDTRVQEVFASAYRDVESSFTQVFSRLFPGGEGRLVLTDPDDMLATGIDVEARPAGKKVKRLSLLSGGERSLVAVAFLVSLFMARPSPFYILDEVEAALDDMNLGRLLDIFAQLGRTSQLLIITHQKRTMEIASSLYGVTMRQDGVSTVISQRLAEDVPPQSPE